jgi:hypothetical protein
MPDSYHECLNGTTVDGESLGVRVTAAIVPLLHTHRLACQFSHIILAAASEGDIYTNKIFRERFSEIRIKD